jgi:hypothetical protein
VSVATTVPLVRSRELFLLDSRKLNKTRTELALCQGPSEQCIRRSSAAKDHLDTIELNSS